MSGVTDLARHIKARDNPSSYTPMFGRIISLPKLVIQLGNNILLDDSDIKSVFDIYETQERDNHTEYSIYKDKQYGANIEDLVIGKSYNFDFAESELRREIETALLRNEDIYSMSGFSAEKVGATLKISFTLNTAYGESAEVYTI